MRAVIQRVQRASVDVDGQPVAVTGPGLCVLVGVETGDTERDAEWMADRLLKLRIFNDAHGKPNLGVTDTGGSILLVSQFTLLGDATGGRRPSYTAAARPEQAEPLFDRVVELCRNSGTVCGTGRFGAQMTVEIINDGPFTILLDSRK